MKNLKSIFKMFKTKHLFLALGIISMLFTSCNDDNNDDLNTDSDMITEEDAVDIIGQSLLPESDGMIEITADAVLIIEGQSSKSMNDSIKTASEEYECNTKYSSSFSSSDDVAPYMHSAVYNWNWIMNCSNLGLPTTFDLELSGDGNYNSPRIATMASNEAIVSVTGLELSAKSYVINQDFTRTSATTSLVRNEKSFSSTLSFATTDLEILKADHLITSGTMAVAFNAESSTGKSYTYTGSLVFNGGKSATLTLNSGSTFEFTWN